MKYFTLKQVAVTKTPAIAFQGVRRAKTKRKRGMVMENSFPQ
jgi:hypothetical protein